MWYVLLYHWRNVFLFLNQECSQRNVVSFENDSLDFGMDLTDLETFGETAPVKVSKMQKVQTEQHGGGKSIKATSGPPVCKKKKVQWGSCKQEQQFTRRDEPCGWSHDEGGSSAGSEWDLWAKDWTAEARLCTGKWPRRRFYRRIRWWEAGHWWLVSSCNTYNTTEAEELTVLSGPPCYPGLWDPPRKVTTVVFPWESHEADATIQKIQGRRPAGRDPTHADSNVQQGRQIIHHCAPGDHPPMHGTPTSLQPNVFGETLRVLVLREKPEPGRRDRLRSTQTCTGGERQHDRAQKLVSSRCLLMWI